MKVVLSILLALTLFACFPGMALAASSKSTSTPIIVLDPGHGGKDTGASKGGIQEKTLNLDIAKRLQKLLKAQKTKVYMTRTTDKFVGLYDRSALANNVNADLFVSIHNNAGSRGDSGTMTLYYPGSAQTDRGLDGRDIASMIQRELSGRLGTANLGLYSRPGLAVLRTTNMPAIIAEVGYISDSKERSKLSSASFRQKSAEALEKAILKVFGKS